MLRTGKVSRMLGRIAQAILGSKQDVRPAMIEGLETRQLLSLVIDVRLPGGGKSIEVDQVGDVVNLEVWAMVTGSDATVNEGFQSVQGSLISSNTNNGSTRGTLFMQLTTLFDDASSQDSDHPEGATAATVDLDGDGDLDVGSNVDSDAAGFMVARSGTMRFSNAVAIPQGREWKLGNLTYTVTELTNPGGTTRINFRRRESIYAALWIEDQTLQKTYSDGTLGNGSPVVITIPSGTSDTTAPTATLSGNSNVTSGGGTTYTFNVNYIDNVGLNLTTLGNTDILVTGPNGFSTAATLTSSPPGTTPTSYNATYSFTAPGGSWGESDNGTYTISMQSNQVADTTGNFVVSGSLGTFNVNIVPPDVTAPSTSLGATNITTGGSAIKTFTVTYNDAGGLNLNTFNTGDVLVTGPNGYSNTATLTSQVPGGSATQYIATYQIPAPGGAWDSADNGTYTIAMQSNQVADVSGNFVAAGSIGSFNVDIEPPAPDNTDPTANASASNISSGGGTTHTITVTFADNVGLNMTSISNATLLVTGPNAFSQNATLISSVPGGSPTQYVATYRINAPGGTWNDSDNGVYTVALVAPGITDTSANASNSGNLTSFTVNIVTDPTPPPTPVLTGSGILIINGTASDDTISVVFDAPKNRFKVNVNGYFFSYNNTSALKRFHIFGLAGNDILSASGNTTTKVNYIDGGLGNDSILGGNANDRLLGGSNNDTIRGGAGNDWIDGGTSNDTMFGDDGNDTLDGNTGNDQFNGGAGTDTANYSGRSAAIVVTLDDIANDGTSGSETDNVKSDVENVLGGSGNDRITGSSANNNLVGGSGSDTLYGGSGNDTLEGGSGADQLFGETGNDVLLARDSTRDTVNGGSGTDKHRTDGNDYKVSVEAVY